MHFMQNGSYVNATECLLQYVNNASDNCFVPSGNNALIEAIWTWSVWPPGGRLNKKDGLTRYGDSHVKDKTS